MTPDEMKQAAMEFCDLMFNQCRPREAIERFVGDDYIQHNPEVGAGKAGFIEYFEQLARDHPDKRLECKRAVAEGDFVVLHLLTSFPTDRDYAGMDIFRFDANGKIVEHWDVLQAIPSESRNGNGMF